MANPDGRVAAGDTGDGALDEAAAATADEYRAGFGEDLARTLDIWKWTEGEDLGAAYARVRDQVREAVEQEERVRRTVRDKLFSRLRDYPGAPRGAGVYQAAVPDLERIHRGLLFNGNVEACDGTIQLHDTLPLTICQLGVSLVSYQGSQGTWGQRLYRRDLRIAGADPVDEMMRLLERRERRGGLNQESRRDRLSAMARRGIMAHAERAALARRSNALWRIGHGNPAPFELLTGSGFADLMIESTRVIRELVERHQKFAYVASEPSDRVLLTIGQALGPLRYAIVYSFKDVIAPIVRQGDYQMKPKVDTRWDDGGEALSAPKWIERFLETVASKIVVGVFRASSAAPAHVFYAHVDHAHVAAHILLADSILQAHRGFPLLIDLADAVCGAAFGGEALRAPASAAYADAGVPWRYQSERATRRD